VDDLIIWLRNEISYDRDAASITGHGGFEPQRWDTKPPGVVNPGGIRNGETWVPLYAYDRGLGDPPGADEPGEAPVAVVRNWRREFGHVIRHDPRNVIADCEAKLAILSLYEKQAAKESENAMEEDRTWALAPVVRHLGHGYRHRDGYREEWKP
jgi:hypothetical protein